MAEILKVHPATINRYCQQNKLTYYLVGSRKRFLKEDIDKYLEGAKRHAEGNGNPFNKQPVTG